MYETRDDSKPVGATELVARLWLLSPLRGLKPPFHHRGLDPRARALVVLHKSQIVLKQGFAMYTNGAPATQNRCNRNVNNLRHRTFSAFFNFEDCSYVNLGFDHCLEHSKNARILSVSPPQAKCM